ncbi:sulfotransferase [Candidatus Woesebacteria bacterium]|nr:sulfotransferase [Candidatus Woesebacteria bacterium]
MPNKTVPVFIIGSGRSGTRMLFRLLSGHEHIEVYHEYLCTHIQPVACKYFMGFFNDKQTKEEINHLHGAGIYYSKAKYWIDCSNKLSWIVKPLYDMFPQAKFIHVMRDGRKVTSSYFHKLSPEIYDDVSVRAMQNWLKNPKKYPEPPPEKKYWWNIPQKNQPHHEDFPCFDQYQRICYHWNQVLTTIEKSLSVIPKKQKMTVKLEDLTKNKEIFSQFLSFIDIEYTDDMFTYMQRPQNVFVPMDFSLNKKQLQQFEEIAGDTLRKCGYLDKEVYTVQY